MSPQPGDPAPWFGAKCYHTDRYVDLSLADLNGSWVLLFFYPLDFGHISPAELLELERVRPALERLGCQVVAVSRDSALVHEQFTSLAPTQGGVAGIRFPLAEDPAGDISRAFGMLMPDSQSSITFRGCFILDPSGIVKGRLTSDLPVGIDIEELVHQVTKLAASEATFTEEDSVTLEHPVEEKLLAVGSSDPATFYTNCILRSREYPKYSQGSCQSPINLSAQSAVLNPDLGPLTFLYRPPWMLQPALGLPAVPLTVRNTGRTWEVAVPAAWQGRITGGPLGIVGQKEDDKNPYLRNAVYRLVSLRAHWGRSEHSLAGRHADLELQLVHINSKYDAAAASVHQDGLAVVSVLLDRRTDGGPVNTELEKIREVLPLIQERGKSAKLAVSLDLEQLLPASPSSYFTYQGSTTEPDFTENVTWVVLEERLQEGVSGAALAAMQELSYGGTRDPRMRSNARQPVPAIGRPVQLWRAQ